MKKFLFLFLISVPPTLLSMEEEKTTPLSVERCSACNVRGALKHDCSQLQYDQSTHSWNMWNTRQFPCRQCKKEDLLRRVCMCEIDRRMNKQIADK